MQKPRSESRCVASSRRVGAVINTKTPSEHVSSHLKRCQNAVAQDLQSSISQAINHSIAYCFFLPFVSGAEGKLVYVLVVHGPAFRVTARDAAADVAAGVAVAV